MLSEETGALPDMAENRRRILVVDYDPAWPDTFEVLRRDTWAAVRDIALSIEHVGSTAVPNHPVTARDE